MRNSNETPDETFYLTSKNRGIDDFIRTILHGDADVGESILAYFGVDRSALDENQENAIDGLEEVLLDGMNGRLRKGQIVNLKVWAEDIKDATPWEAESEYEEALKAKMIDLTGTIEAITEKEGELIENVEEELMSVIESTEEICGMNPEMSGSFGEGLVAEIKIMLGEKDEDKKEVMKRILEDEMSLVNALKGLLTPLLIRKCGVNENYWKRTVNESAILTNLIGSIICIIFTRASVEERRRLVQGAIDEAVKNIRIEKKAASTRVEAMEVLTAASGDEATINIGNCPIGREIVSGMDEWLTSHDDECPTPENDEDAGPTDKDLDEIEKNRS